MLSLCTKPTIVSALTRSRLAMACVEQLPIRNQSTRGGNPRARARSTKSLSLLTIVKPCVRANSKTTSSAARASPSSWT